MPYLHTAKKAAFSAMKGRFYNFKIHVGPRLKI